MLEIYTGDGKGKSTAAAGLAVRAAGHGIPVYYAQMLKDGTSGEMEVLKSLPSVRVFVADAFFGFTFRMTEEEKKREKEALHKLLDDIRSAICRNAAAGKSMSSGRGTAGKGGQRPSHCRPAALCVVDEVLTALARGMVDEKKVLAFLDAMPDNVETVFTGREGTEELSRRADYVSVIRCEKHPYRNGIRAREGIEF